MSEISAEVLMEFAGLTQAGRDAVRSDLSNHFYEPEDQTIAAVKEMAFSSHQAFVMMLGTIPPELELTVDDLPATKEFLRSLLGCVFSYHRFLDIEEEGATDE